MNITEKLIKSMLRAIGGDQAARAEIQPAIDMLRKEDAAEAERIALEEAEAARLAEKRKHDKYELLPAKRDGSKFGAFQQIRAIKYIRPGIPAGTLGGYVGSEANLDQSGTCWIYPEAVVKDSARVAEEAEVHAGCVIKDRAQVSGSASLYMVSMNDDTMVNGSAELRYCTMSNGACMTGSAKAQHAIIRGNAYIGGEVQLWGEFMGSGGEMIIDGGQLDGKFAMTLSDVFGHARNLSPDGELPVVAEDRRRRARDREISEQSRREKAEADRKLEEMRKRNPEVMRIKLAEEMERLKGQRGSGGFSAAK